MFTASRSLISLGWIDHFEKSGDNARCACTAASGAGDARRTTGTGAGTRDGRTTRATDGTAVARCAGRGRAATLTRRIWRRSRRASAA